MPRTRLAICGFGLVGQRHAAAAALVPDVDVAAVEEPAGENRAKAEALGFTCFDDLDALFAAGGVDGVIVATPTPLHVTHALAALARDCPVLVEKPIAVTSDEAGALVAASEARGIPVLVGHHRRHNPLIRRAREVIASGAIGEVRAVTATCWFYKPDSYFDAAPWRKRAGAGPISVNLVHDVDLIRHLCGEVRRVTASAATSARGYDNEDVAAAVLDLANGAIATITVSDSIVAPWSWELTARENPAYPPTDQSCYLIGGSKGALSLPDLRLWTHAGGLRDWWAPMTATTLTRDAADPLVEQIRHFRDTIRGAAAPLVPAAEGLRTLRVIEAIARAAATGWPVDLPRDRPDDAGQAAE